MALTLRAIENVKKTKQKHRSIRSGIDLDLVKPGMQ